MSAPSPVLPPRRARGSRLGGVLGWSARVLLAVYFVCASSVFAVRHWVLPNADAFRGEIAASISTSLGLPVRIGSVTAEWIGLRPTLALAELVISDAQGRRALGLAHVDATLSWTSLLRRHPVFRRLEIHAPELAVRREPDGRLLVAGLDVANTQEGGGFGEWLLDQPEIVVRRATLTWSDGQRPAPSLVLSDVDLRLENRGHRHRFGFTASPPVELAGRMDVRGDFQGADLSNWAGWRGELFVGLERADLSAWQQWVDYPVPLAGSGAANLWIARSGPAAYTGRVDLALADARTRLRPDLPELTLPRLEGTISVARKGGTLHLETRGLAAEGGAGVALPPLALSLDYDPGAGSSNARGRIAADHLDLGALASLAAHLPFEPHVLEKIAALAPSGELFEARYDWRGASDAPAAWQVSGRLAQLRLLAGDGWPGVAGLSGHFAGDQQRGSFALEGADASIDLPTIFDEPRVPLAALAVQGRWQSGEAGVEIHVDHASFENRDAAGTASFVLRPASAGPGEIDLEARLSRADGTRVWRYLPRVVGAATRDWVRSAILAGRARGAVLRLKGDLRDFPFADGKRGTFLVTAPVEGVGLKYAPDWPAIEDIAGELRFEGQAMHILARGGRVGEALIAQTRADIADLGHHDAVLEVKGAASGPTRSFLAFVSSSPVSAWINHFTDPIRAEGDGELALSLTLTLNRIEESRVDGEYRFARNAVRLFEGLPELREARARLGFTTTGLSISDASARLLGQPVAVRGKTDADGVLTILGSGIVTAVGLRRETGLELLEHLGGRAGFTTQITVHGKGATVVVDSELLGLGSSLPAPLEKDAADPLPLRLQLDAEAGGAQQRWRVTLGDALRGELARSQSPSGAWTLKRAGVAVNAPLEVAEGGLRAVVDVPALDLDAWRALPGSGSGGGAPGVASFTLRSGQLRVFGEEVANVDVRADADAGGWRGKLASEAIEGDFDWRSRDQGTLTAQFKRLSLGARKSAESRAVIRAAAEAAPSSLPALDVTAEQFRLRGMELGSLTLFARNGGGQWILDKLALSGPDAEIAGKGEWRPGGRTRLEFGGTVSDVGAYLAQIGYPDAVRRGKATLSGELGWQGAPTEVDYPSLSGELKVGVDDGQFNKLEPGVGRLLGVLSLQSLPRRITLDFNDVFSEGFAFDRIEGAMGVDAGVMHTSDLSIRGPAARIRLSGSVNLAAETQDLRVDVQPTLSESVAVGAALANSAAGVINPVAGLVAYLAQKIMQDPIEKLFSYHYAVTGGWGDPQVEEIRSKPTAAPQ